MPTTLENFRMTLPYQEYESLRPYDITPARHTSYLGQATSLALFTLTQSPLSAFATAANLVVSYYHRQNRLRFDGCEDPADNKKTAKPIELVNLAAISNRLMMASSAINATCLFYESQHGLNSQTHNSHHAAIISPAEGADIGGGLCLLAGLYAVARHYKIKQLRKSLVPI